MSPLYCRSSWVLLLLSSLGGATEGYADHSLETRERVSSLEDQINDMRDRLEFMENSQSGGGASEGGSFSPQLGQMVARLQSLEGTLQELRGEMERVRHQTQLMEREMGVLKADVEMRFQMQQKALTPAMGAAAPAVVSKDAIGQLIEREEAQKKTGVKGADPQRDKKAFEEIQSLVKKKNFKEAANLSRKFLKEIPQSSYTGAVTLIHGQCLAQQGLHQKAAAFLVKGYQKSPKSKKAPDILFQASQSLAALKKKKESCAILENLQEEFSSLPETLKTAIQKSIKEQGC